MPKRVLIVEDDRGMRESLRKLLELEGYEVVTAVDGRDGLDRMHEGAEVVICDVMMPRLDGFGFAAELERRGLRNGAKLIVLTASGRARDQAELLRIDCWLEKPVDIVRLLGEVERLVADPVGAD